MLFQALHCIIARLLKLKFFASLALVVASSFTAQAQAVTVDFVHTKSWSGGYLMDVVITNDTSNAINGWTLSFKLGSGIEKMSRATFTGSDPFTVKSLSYSALIGAGETEPFSYNGIGVFNKANLGNCVFNGSACRLLVNGAPIGGVASSSPASSKPASSTPVSSSEAAASSTPGSSSEAAASSTPASSIAPSSVPASSSEKSSSSAPSGNYGSLVLDQNFNQHTTVKSFSETIANQDFDVGTRDFRGSDGNTVGNGVLRAFYPKNKILGQDTGFVFDAFFQSSDEATLEYRVRFDGDFDFSKGGKLPGLGGTNQSQSPTGCTQNQSQIDNGWSARLMWHTGGKLVVYTYFPDRSSNCGTPTTVLNAAQKNRWYTIREHVKMNTPGQHNGLLEVYIDGQLGMRVTNALFRLSGKDNVKTNNILMHTYRGGSTQDWASPEDAYTSFDDFKVWVK